MQQPETIKPLVERILAQPLQFKMATEPDSIEGRPESCIVIGSTRLADQRSDGRDGPSASSSSAGGEAKIPGSGMSKGNRKSMPKNFLEALQMYTASKPLPEDVELSDAKYQSSSGQEDASSSSSESAAEEFHEANDYLETESHSSKDASPASNSGQNSEDLGEDIGEDIGEDLGEDLSEDLGEDIGDGAEADEDAGPALADIEAPEDEDTASGASGSTEDSQDDADFQDEMNEDSDSEVSIDNITDNEKMGLMREAQEHAQSVSSVNAKAEERIREEEHREEQGPESNEPTEDDGEILKHKEPSSKRTSPTPPIVLSDMDRFYQFNEKANDRGTNNSKRLLKNWGPQLSTMKPKGLLNHGVTCYTNAAVQALVHIPAIQHYLFDVLRGEYKSTIAPQSVTQVLAETTKRMWSNESSKNQFINPKKLIGRLDDINCMMSEWQQEDSHEYFMSLISRLQEDSVPRGHKLTESILYDIFGGLLRQEVTCKSCGEVSKTEQPIYDLSLHLKGKKNSSQGESAKNSSEYEEEPQRRFSIEKSIRDFFNPELIKADKATKEGYVCEKCHKTTNASKHNFLLRAPETLLVHLKKFRFNGTSSSKLKQAVSYPMFLDLTEYCENSATALPVKYQLISVVVHEGRSLSSGHYIAHCKQPDGSWSTYDDEYINKISEKQMLKEPGAYYLVYTRLTPKSVPLENSVQVKQFRTANTKGSDTNTSSETSTQSASKKKKNKNKNKNKKRRLTPN